VSKQIAIKDGDKKYWISIDEFKKLLFKEEISTKGVPLAYPERVEAFFNQLHSHKILNTWHDAYPNVDLATELKKAKSWLISNTGKAKKDFTKFCNNWLARAMKNPNKTAVVKSRHEKSNEDLYKQKRKWAKEKPASQEEIKDILKEFRG